MTQNYTVKGLTFHTSAALAPTKLKCIVSMYTLNTAATKKKENPQKQSLTDF